MLDNLVITCQLQEIVMHVLTELHLVFFFYLNVCFLVALNALFR